MLVDTSQSVQSEAARARYDEALETILSAFREGGSLDGKRMWVGVDRISANSLTESNIREVELPGKSFNTNPLEHENKLDAAVEELGREFDNIASTPPDDRRDGDRRFARERCPLLREQGRARTKVPPAALGHVRGVAVIPPGRRAHARRQTARC